jgi:hypothetical protein
MIFMRPIRPAFTGAYLLWPRMGGRGSIPIDLPLPPNSRDLMIEGSGA